MKRVANLIASLLRNMNEKDWFNAFKLPVLRANLRYAKEDKEQVADSKHQCLITKAAESVEQLELFHTLIKQWNDYDADDSNQHIIGLAETVTKLIVLLEAANVTVFAKLQVVQVGTPECVDVVCQNPRLYILAWCWRHTCSKRKSLHENLNSFLGIRV